jgi:hypothetical protein
MVKIKFGARTGAASRYCFGSGSIKMTRLHAAPQHCSKSSAPEKSPRSELDSRICFSIGLKLHITVIFV